MKSWNGLLSELKEFCSSLALLSHCPVTAVTRTDTASGSGLRNQLGKYLFLGHLGGFITCLA